MRRIFLPLILLTSFSSYSQNLLPAINNGVLPDNSDPICSTPWYNNLNFDTTGYMVGDTVNDFTLFSISGDTFHLADQLAQGKPVLLIAGSLTCPYFRSRIQHINTLVSVYAPYVNTTVVYVIEPHPTDTSPYTGNVNVTSQNVSQNVLHPQPTTYQERKNLVDTLIQAYTTNFPIVLDTPCNEWWNAYGPAPLNAYLIDTTGIVIMKHGWFHQYPDNIYCDLDSIFNLTLPYCVPSSTNGSFIMNPLTITATGAPGTVIYGTADLINNSGNDVLIEVVKTTEIYAPGWNSAFCMGICYSATVDSTTVPLVSGDTIHFSLDFFTSAIPDSSRVRVGFRNRNYPNNAFSQWFYGYTYYTGVNENQSTPSFSVYPNPANDQLNVGVVNGAKLITVCDVTGRTIMEVTIPEGQTTVQLALSALAPGMYYVIQSGEGIRSTEKFLKE